MASDSPTGPSGRTRPPRVAVIGVSGAGKSTVGARLAEALVVPFMDGDELHPPANVAKMAAGHPLDDEDRAPWLAAVAAWLADHPDGGVVACSALRRRYRDVLRAAAPDLALIHLDGDTSMIVRRVSDRAGHYMPATLVASQLAALEPLEADERGVVVDPGAPLDLVLRRCLTWLGEDRRSRG